MSPRTTTPDPVASGGIGPQDGPHPSGPPPAAEPLEAETPERNSVGPTTVANIRSADYLKRTAEALAILAPVSAGGCGYISRDEGRRFLNRLFAGFDLPIASELMTIINGEPTPLPQALLPQLGDRGFAWDPETNEPTVYEFTEEGWRPVDAPEPPPTAPVPDEQEQQA